MKINLNGNFFLCSKELSKKLKENFAYFSFSALDRVAGVSLSNAEWPIVHLTERSNCSMFVAQIEMCVCELIKSMCSMMT